MDKKHELSEDRKHKIIDHILVACSVNAITMSALAEEINVKPAYISMAKNPSLWEKLPVSAWDKLDDIYSNGKIAGIIEKIKQSGKKMQFNRAKLPDRIMDELAERFNTAPTITDQINENLKTKSLIEESITKQPEKIWIDTAIEFKGNMDSVDDLCGALVNAGLKVKLKIEITQ